MSTSTIPKADQGDGKPDYLPTPEEIRDACRLIRAGWSKEEEYQRRTTKNPEARIIGTDRMPIWENVESTRQKLRVTVPPGKNWIGQK